MAEFGLIRRLQEIIDPGQSGRHACVVGIGDDAAVLEVSSGGQLVVCTDTLVEGVHFSQSTSPRAIGHKSLAVNLSDLAAMGAEPAWFFLALTLPDDDPAWVDEFGHGMADLAGEAGIVLAGGDTTAGALSITVTALGFVEAGRALERAGAREGDLVLVSGRPGAAAHALECLRSGVDPAPEDLKALDYPQPRLALGRALRGLATSCIDLSDGLLADLGHVLAASGVGAEVALAKLPTPSSLEDRPEEERWPLQLAGGDDYELCFTAPSNCLEQIVSISKTCQVRISVIGEIKAAPVIVLRTPGGGIYSPPRPGYEHFSSAGGRE